MMMEAASLNENAPGVTPYEIGARVEIDAGRGEITGRHQAPGGLWWYDVSVTLRIGEQASLFTRWHDETTPAPVEEMLVPPVAEIPGPASVGVVKFTPATSVDEGFKDLLDKGAAIIASIETIKALDVVVLRSGGPQMLVEKIDGDHAMAWWMDHSANLHVARFPLSMISIVPAFDHSELRA